MKKLTLPIDLKTGSYQSEHIVSDQEVRQAVKKILFFIFCFFLVLGLFGNIEVKDKEVEDAEIAKETPIIHQNLFQKEVHYAPINE